jgi:hypothetical protein
VVLFVVTFYGSSTGQAAASASKAGALLIVTSVHHSAGILANNRRLAGSLNARKARARLDILPKMTILSACIFFTKSKA